MPFCSLEEAWGSDFYENNLESKKFNKIVDNKYHEIDYSDESINNKEKKNKKKKSFSRTYNRLKNHTGPKTRLPENQYYNINKEQNNNIKENFIEKNVDSNNYIKFLMNENIELKNMIKKYKNNNDGVFDLVIFLSSGVFIIFLLDIITKSIRKF